MASLRQSLLGRDPRVKQESAGGRVGEECVKGARRAGAWWPAGWSSISRRRGTGERLEEGAGGRGPAGCDNVLDFIPVGIHRIQSFEQQSTVIGLVFKKISLAAEGTVACRKLGVEAETSWEVLEAEEVGGATGGVSLGAVGLDSGKYTVEQESQTLGGLIAAVMAFLGHGGEITNPL